MIHFIHTMKVCICPLYMARSVFEQAVYLLSPAYLLPNACVKKRDLELHMTNKKHSIYTEDSYRKLVKTVQEIRKETRPAATAALKKNNDAIKASLKKIAEKHQFMPSYEMFLNKLVNDMELKKAKASLKKMIFDKKIQGFAPDIRVIVDTLITPENIKSVEDEIIAQLKRLNNL